MMISGNQVTEMFRQITAVMEAHSKELCEMDAKLGDGDLGLTMKKGFAAALSALQESTEEDLGKRIMKAGVQMSSAVPSTMGTLMASGILSGGKKLVGKKEIDTAGLCAYINGFAEGIQKRGKCELGDRTVLDSVGNAAKQAEEYLKIHGDATVTEVILAAYEGAVNGVESTKSMSPKFGKAAVHKEACAGNVDQGAVAGCYMLEAMKDYILEMEEIE